MSHGDNKDADVTDINSSQGNNNLITPSSKGDYVSLDSDQPASSLSATPVANPTVQIQPTVNTIEIPHSSSAEVPSPSGSSSISYSHARRKNAVKGLFYRSAAFRSIILCCFTFLLGFLVSFLHLITSGLATENIQCRGVLPYTDECKNLALVPLSLLYFVAGLVAYPAQLCMQRKGKEWAFNWSTVIGMVGSALCIGAVYVDDSTAGVTLMSLGAGLTGVQFVFSLFLRFIAAELSPEWFRSRAIALTILGGVVAAIAGPKMAAPLRDMLNVSFAGVYVILLVLQVAYGIALQFIRFPEAKAEIVRSRMSTISRHSNAGDRAGGNVLNPQPPSSVRPAQSEKPSLAHYDKRTLRFEQTLTADQAFESLDDDRDGMISLSDVISWLFVYRGMYSTEQELNDMMNQLKRVETQQGAPATDGGAGEHLPMPAPSTNSLSLARVRNSIATWTHSRPGKWVMVLKVDFVAWYNAQRIGFLPMLAAPVDDILFTRPLWDILRQPSFYVPMVSASVSYCSKAAFSGVAPLVMAEHGLSFSHVSDALLAHAVGQFTPSFITGHLIAYIGMQHVVQLGFALLLLGEALFYIGYTPEVYAIGLFFVGIGWNFSFVACTALVDKSYNLTEKPKAQGVNDTFVMFGAGIGTVVSVILAEAIGWYNFVGLHMALNGFVLVINFTISQNVGSIRGMKTDVTGDGS